MKSTQLRLTLFTTITILFIGAFASWMSVYYKNVSEEFVRSWIATEDINIQEGEILATFGKGQQLLLSSNFVDAIMVIDLAHPNSPVMAVGPKINVSESDLTAEPMRTRWAGLFSYKVIVPLPQNLIAVFHTRWRTAGLQISILLGLLALGGLIIYEFTRRITEAKRQAEIELGQFAAQVAHDIRSPLTALDVAVGKLNADSEIFDLIRMSSNRIRTIADDLLKKERRSSQPSLTATPTDLQDLLRTFARQKQAEIGERYSLKLDLGEPQFMPWLGPATDLERVLSNLTNNAFESSAEGMSVRLTLRSFDKGYIISVKDSGAGISPEILPRLTKEKISVKANGHQGNGIGLFSAAQTIRSWSGSIEIESTVGIGTTVKFTIPRGK